jgi:mRNA-degrading endonuclease RelE of RelBE toxin-antitoxin system
MEIFNQIWVWIGTALGGISLAGIISTIIYGCLKGAFNRTIAKINVQKIADQATEKGVEKVKKVSFSHTIQPLVESELKKLNEHYVEVLKVYMESVAKKYDNLVLVLEKLSAYFDNSIGVNETAKQELKQVLAEAKNEQISAESVVVEEIIEQTPIQVAEPKETAKLNTKVER